jgi:hypothetical protein
MRRLAVILALGLLFAPRAAAQDRLEDLVGWWQSDTVAGASVQYACDRTPLARAVVCEETLMRAGRGGAEQKVVVFTADSSSGWGFSYDLSGEKAPPTRVLLRIVDHVWTFGDTAPTRDRAYHRTFYDFSTRDGTFSWREESSRDGRRWTVDRAGTAHQTRPLVPG